MQFYLKTNETKNHFANYFSFYVVRLDVLLA